MNTETSALALGVGLDHSRRKFWHPCYSEEGLVGIVSSRWTCQDISQMSAVSLPGEKGYCGWWGKGAERVSLKPRTEAKDPFCLSLRVVVP